MRKLFISDIHGCYDEMMALLEHVNYDPLKDKLIVGGDMIDRGPDSGKVIRHIRKLQDQYGEGNVIVLAGNHEDMLRMFLHKENAMWIQHGGVEASKSFTEEFPDQVDLNEHLVWLLNLPYIKWDTDYVYVHAGIDPTHFLHNQPREECLWMPYTPKNQRFSDVSAKDIIAVTAGRKVIHGHTPKPYVFDDGVRMCCDLGAAVKEQDAKLALVDLTYDIVHSYHFNNKVITTTSIARKKVNA